MTSFLNLMQIFKLNETLNAKCIWIWMGNLLDKGIMTPFHTGVVSRLCLKISDDYFHNGFSFDFL